MKGKFTLGSLISPKTSGLFHSFILETRQRVSLNMRGDFFVPLPLHVETQCEYLSPRVSWSISRTRCIDWIVNLLEVKLRKLDTAGAGYKKTEQVRWYKKRDNIDWNLNKRLLNIQIISNVFLPSPWGVVADKDATWSAVLDVTNFDQPIVGRTKVPWSAILSSCSL